MFSEIGCKGTHFSRYSQMFLKEIVKIRYFITFFVQKFGQIKGIS